MPFLLSRRGDSISWPWWAVGLAVGLGLVAAVCGSVLAIGFPAPYWMHADQDLVLAYHGLLFNADLPQEYFDHPGYTYFLVIAGWYRFLHEIGWLPFDDLPGLPPASDAAFAVAWQRLIEAGRLMSMGLCGAFVALYALLVTLLVGDRRIGALAGLALAFGVGVSTQARELRTELLAAPLVVTALLLTLLAARRVRPGRAWPLLALAGVAAMLAVTVKLQAIFVALAIVPLALAFGHREETGARAAPASWPLALGLVVAAVAAALPAGELLRAGIAGWEHGAYAYRPVGAGLSGIYQWLVVAGVAGAMLLYARVWRVPAAAAIQALAAVALGSSLGLLVLLVRFDARNVVAVANFVEHMFVFSSWKHADALAGQEQVLTGGLIGVLLEGLGRTLAIRTLVLHPDNVPQSLIFEWFALGGAIVLWRRGERAEALRALLLLLTAWGLITVFSLRGSQRAYALFTEPLTILAASLVAARLPELFATLRRRRWIAGVFAAYLLAAHVWPLLQSRRPPDPAQNCGWIPGAIARVGPFPFCVRP